MARMYEYLPELEGDEALYVTKLFDSMDEDQAKLFSQVYRARRRDPMTILILIIIGFFGVAGIHRIFIGQIGMGILYLLTAGLCLVGSIVDVINYKNLAFEANREIAREIYTLVDH